jgi:hypothetical protein
MICCNLNRENLARYRYRLISSAFSFYFRILNYYFFIFPFIFFCRPFPFKFTSFFLFYFRSVGCGIQGGPKYHRSGLRSENRTKKGKTHEKNGTKSGRCLQMSTFFYYRSCRFSSIWMNDEKTR